MNRFAPSPALQEELEETGCLHRPLPLHRENSLEARARDKRVRVERPLWDGSPGGIEGWSGEGPGVLVQDGLLTPGGKVSLRLELPTTRDHWPAEAPDGDYVPFCRQYARLNVGGENWEAYNRLAFWIYPDCPGARTVNIALIFANQGALSVPDPHGREGHHEVSLVNREWNQCFLEIPELPRDRITMIGFESPAFGKDRSTGDFLRFHIGEIYLQRVEEPGVAHGWLPGPGKIAYSMSGYSPGGAKTAILRGPSPAAPEGRAGEDAREGADAGEGAAFTVKDARGKTAFEGRGRPITGPRGNFEVLDFSALGEGEYTLHCGAAATRPFRVAENIWADSLWKALNFTFCERCGYPVSEKHGLCHGDITVEHGGLRVVYNGGWHDAGDMSQQTLQTGDVVFSLLELARKVRGEDRRLYRRLIEEAEWGLEFTLKCRFGDGYRASSAGIVTWSDGFLGNMDDRPGRVQNNSFDNFLYAAYEAYAAGTLVDDPMLCEGLVRFAEEDFAFARAAYEKQGFSEKPVYWEHSYPTSPSQHMATMSWAASLLYQLTRKETYAVQAARAMEYPLQCQRTEALGETGLRGFFYRDTRRRVIQHFSHQSRDQVYAQALALLLETQGEHQDAPKWRASLELYAAYLKGLAPYTAPYGMLPSGVYHIDEAQDEESFERQHRFPGESAREDYAAQLRSGQKLDGEHYLRIFPVWFSFRGNSAVHLSTGKAAAICGNVLKDPALLDIAREQLYWVLGKNPFCQSLMYGEGYDYPEQAVFLPGTMTGQLPVGIQTRYQEDVPYWPQANNATYKEVWLTVAGKWFSLVAELS
jgi:hypothetical protein